ncbi:MAG: hypothetical protein M0Z52_00025 [Actinomycetota bacterium]|nr:hypothetical protein [Actinomycetota bacterium]
MNAALEQIYGGMEQMTSGFFDTWKLFMLNRPLPEANSEYKLETAGPQQYLLTYKEGTADIATNMGQNFAISNLKVVTPQFNSSIQPSFTTSPDGYILSAYTADYTSGNPAEATKLNVTMDYQVVQGLQMLKDLSLSGTYGGNPFGVNLTFSDCTLTKK